jgi:hypothetical protein
VVQALSSVLGQLAWLGELLAVQVQVLLAVQVLVYRAFDDST